MTFCLGVKYKNSVYLLADSAATGVGASKYRDVSSFGERVDEENDVAEAALKIARIASNCYAALAGDVPTAYKIVKSLQELLRHSKLADAIQSLKISFDPPQEPYEILIASTEKTGGNALYRLSGKSFDLTEIDSYCSIGNLTSWHRSAVESSVRSIAASDAAEDQVLSHLISYIQLFTLTDVLHTQGVGGFFSGMRLSCGKARWIEDTNFAILDQQNLDLVRLKVRTDVVGVSSTYYHDVPQFYLSVLSTDLETWDRESSSSFIKEFNELSASTWIFIEMSRRVVVVITHANEFLDFIFTFNKVDGGYHLQIKSEELHTILESSAGPNAVRFVSVPCALALLYLPDYCEKHGLTAA